MLTGPRLGVDVVRVSRIADSMIQFGSRFVSRVFTPGEIAHASRLSPRRATESYAARFAAKEATMKALGRVDLGWQAIEVQRTESGACVIELHGLAKEHARQLNIREIALSMSHEDDYAIAMVIAESAAA